MGLHAKEWKEYDRQQEESRFKLPHVYVILFAMMVLGYLATYLIPSGTFERQQTESGANILIPGTFQFTEEVNLSIFDFIFAIPTGMVQAGEIIFGGLMMGGLVAVLEKAGLLPLVVHKIVTTLKSRTILVIPLLMIPIAVFTTITGALEMILIYVPIIVPLVVKMGFDRFTGLALVLVSATAGFSTGITAPATLGLSQEITELPLYSGAVYRMIIFTIITGIGIWYVWNYARKVQRDPSNSYVYDDGYDNEFLTEDKGITHKSTAKQKIGLVVLTAGFGIMLYGLLVWKWYFVELGGWYAFLGIVIGLICGMNGSQIAETFHEGFKTMLLGVLLIGLARSISIILEEGNILDTIVFGITQVVGMVPGEVTAVAMMLVQGLFNFLVGSGSGQAMITMPIMSGLSDLLGVTRQTAVLAFQFGDGFTNILYPTAGPFMATLALAYVSWGKWVKFVLPILGIWIACCTVFLIIAQMIGWN
ncbi:YfcC family protein [Thalassobacillus devorans]|uniref:YfcC family protein n=1 Tax=Thalassobacillus devorans TaxID=279813 RepID=UPI00048B3490|nr:Na+/H+ antiporter NhaC family protein [Thalassobacillus devorans]